MQFIILMNNSELESVAESGDFPEEFFQVKVLPELLKFVEFGGGGPKPFGLVMKIATNYQTTNTMRKSRR